MRRTLLAVVLVLAATGAGIAAASTFVSAPPAFESAPPHLLPGPAELVVGARLAPSAEGPEWAVRTYISRTGLLCVERGRLRAGVFGDLGEDGQFQPRPAGPTGICGDPRENAVVAGIEQAPGLVACPWAPRRVRCSRATDCWGQPCSSSPSTLHQSCGPIAPSRPSYWQLPLIEIVVVFPLVFASLPRSIDPIRQAMLAFIALTTVMAVIAIGIFLSGAARGGLGQTGLPFDLNKNGIGSFLAAGLVMAYALGVAQRRDRLKRVLQVAVLVEFAGVFATLSRGSIIGAPARSPACGGSFRPPRCGTPGAGLVLMCPPRGCLPVSGGYYAHSRADMSTNATRPARAARSVRTRG